MVVFWGWLYLAEKFRGFRYEWNFLAFHEKLGDFSKLSPTVVARSFIGSVMQSQRFFFFSAFSKTVLRFAQFLCALI